MLGLPENTEVCRKADERIALHFNRFTDIVAGAANFYAYHWHTDASNRLGPAVVEKAIDDTNRLVESFSSRDNFPNQ